MNPQEIDKRIQQGIETYMRNKQFNYSKIASHEHNGVDTVQINQKDIIKNNKITSFLTETNDTAGTVTYTTTMNNTPNLNSISFYGFIANNASGAAATKRAIINGKAEIGLCYGSNGITLLKSPFNIIQVSNSMYVDSTNLANNRVSATNGDAPSNLNGHFCYAANETGTVLVSTVVTYTNSKIIFTTTLVAGWKLQGALIIN